MDETNRQAAMRLLAEAKKGRECEEEEGRSGDIAETLNMALIHALLAIGDGKAEL